jgi:hypothetical protein
MQGLKELLEWYNLIYTIPLGVGLLYLLVTALTGLGHGEGGYAADHDADVGHDVGHEMDVAHGVDAAHDVDADADADADADHDVEHDAEHETHHANGGHGFVKLAWSFTGADQVPFSMFFQSVCILWGVLGLIVNNTMRVYMSQTRSLLPAALVTLVVTALLMRLTARFMARVTPRGATAAVGRRGLLGAVGEAVFEIDHDSGAAHVRDAFGTMHQVACRTERGVIPRGKQVLLLDYVEDKDYFIVQEVSVPPSVAEALTRNPSRERERAHPSRRQGNNH